MKRMVIKGSEWHRGRKTEWGPVELLTQHGRRCCIGIHARLCGIPDNHVKGYQAAMAMHPEDVTKCYSPWVKTGKYGLDNSELADDAMPINDNADTTDAEKIAALRPIFAEIGVSIVWRPEL